MKFKEKVMKNKIKKIRRAIERNRTMDIIEPLTLFVDCIEELVAKPVAEAPAKVAETPATVDEVKPKKSKRTKVKK